MIIMKRTQSTQAGFVSIFTVLFFIILITVLTVGFLRIVGDEQRQSTDNELTASALASAEAGVEDAKRALILYKRTGDSDLKRAFDAGKCDTLTQASVAAKLKINQGALSQNQSAFLQDYTCVTVKLDTQDYRGTALKGQSIIIPLDGTNNFDTVSLSWHDPNQDGKPGNLAISSLLPDIASWQQQGVPSYVRAEIIPVPNGNFRLSDLESNARTAYFVPGSNIGSNDTVDLNGYDSRSPTDQTLRQKSAPFLVHCDKNAQPYVCTINIHVTGPLAPANQKLYLRLTSIYASTHFSVALKQGGNAIPLNEVQPIVDSTGRANDVFRRVQARVDFSNATLPEFALESGDDICKNFEVTQNPADYKDNSPVCQTP